MLVSGIRRHRQFRRVAFSSVRIVSLGLSHARRSPRAKPAKRASCTKIFHTFQLKKTSKKFRACGVGRWRGCAPLHLGDLFKDLRCRICLQVIAWPMDVGVDVDVDVAVDVAVVCAQQKHGRRFKLLHFAQNAGKLAVTGQHTQEDPSQTMSWRLSWRSGDVTADFDIHLFLLFTMT